MEQSNFIQLAEVILKRRRKAFIKLYRQSEIQNVYAMYILVLPDLIKGEDYFKLRIGLPAESYKGISDNIKATIEADPKFLYIVFNSKDSLSVVYKLTRKKKSTP